MLSEALIMDNFDPFLFSIKSQISNKEMLTILRVTLFLQKRTVLDVNMSQCRDSLHYLYMINFNCSTIYKKWKYGKLYKILKGL